MKFSQKSLFTIGCVLLIIASICRNHLLPFSLEKKDSCKKISLLPNDPKSKNSTIVPPARLSQVSEEELKFFPGAVVVAAKEIEGTEPHQKIDLRILKTNFKSCTSTSGFIRTEEVIDEQTGASLYRYTMLADHLLVSLSKNETPEHLLEQLGPQATAITPVTPDGVLWDLTLSRGDSLETIPTALESIATLQGALAEHDFMIYAAASNSLSYFFAPFYLRNQWALWETSGGIDAYDAWKIQKDAPSVIVAVIDSGIRYTHEDLAKNIWCDPADVPEGNLHGIDIIDKNNKSMDPDGHGTHCAGIIGGQGKPGEGGLPEGTFGVAPKIQLMACRILDTYGVGTESGAISGIDYAIRHGATILNCSLTIQSDYDGSSYYSTSLFKAIQKAQAAGVILVASAGNWTKEKDAEENTIWVANDNDKRPIYPASYRLDNIVSVTASTFSWLSICELSPASNFGATTVHLAAPGINILSTYNTSDNAYEVLSGSSMATAFVTGTLALLRQHYPQASYQELIGHLLATTDDALKLRGKVMHGHLNAGRALQTPLSQ